MNEINALQTFNIFIHYYNTSNLYLSILYAFKMSICTYNYELKNRIQT